MPNTKQQIFLFSLLTAAVVLLFLINISLGSVAIPIGEVAKGLSGGEMQKESWNVILWNFRLPKAFTAVLAGMGLSVSGLLMQTLFRNPLAGPYVLGLNSGAGLGVAFVVMGASILPSFFLSPYGLTIASGLGSFAVLLAVLAVAKQLKDTMTILIVGLMFSSFTSAIVSVLSYFSTAEQLQKFTFWSLGSISNLSWNEVGVLGLFILTGILLAVATLKSLNALLLGERYAKSMGINLKKTRNLILLATSILAGSVTALAGPITFVGLAVPHIAKLIFRTSNHTVLLWATLIIGAVIMLVCDTLSHIPYSDITLPINAITSIIGAPVVIWLISRRRVN